MRGSWEPAALIHHFGPGQLQPVWSIQTQCGPGDIQHIAAQNVTLDSDYPASFRSRLFQPLELYTQYCAYLAKLDPVRPNTAILQGASEIEATIVL